MLRKMGPGSRVMAFGAICSPGMTEFSAVCDYFPVHRLVRRSPGEGGSFIGGGFMFICVHLWLLLKESRET